AYTDNSDSAEEPRRAVGQRLETPLQPDRLVGSPIWGHGVNLGIERGPIVAEAHHWHRAIRILLGRKQRAANARCSIGRVVILIPVHDAAVPGIVVLRRPRLAVRGAGAFVGICLIAAGTVVLIPSIRRARPFDPG